jgi:hypothetical protein
MRAKDPLWGDKRIVEGGVARNGTPLRLGGGHPPFTFHFSPFTGRYFTAPNVNPRTNCF